MSNGIDHNIEYDSREDSLSLNNRKIGLSLSTQAYRPLPIITAYLLCQNWILDDDAQSKEIELSIMGDPWRPIGVLE